MDKDSGQGFVVEPYCSLQLGRKGACLVDKEAHKKRHEELHAALDELVADFITHTEKMPSETTLIELMQWASEQKDNPTEREGVK